MPELFGEVELDLITSGLIPDLEHALNTRTWHFVRTAVLRLIHTPGSWVREELERGRIRRGSTALQDPVGRQGDVRPGHGRDDSGDRGDGAGQP